MTLPPSLGYLIIVCQSKECHILSPLQNSTQQLANMQKLIYGRGDTVLQQVVDSNAVYKLHSRKWQITVENWNKNSSRLGFTQCENLLEILPFLAIFSHCAKNRAIFFFSIVWDEMSIQYCILIEFYWLRKRTCTDWDENNVREAFNYG